MPIAIDGVRTPDPPHLPKRVPTQIPSDFTFPNRDTPKTRPILDPNLRRRTFRGVCFCAPTRVHEKFGGFYISAPGCAKKPPSFTPNPSARLFEGRMQYAPTRVRAKFGGFHISAHGHTKNAPDFRRKPSSRDISGRMQYAPTRVRAKFGGFHISASGYAQNPPDFTFPNKDAPKTRQILDPKPCRRTFSGRMQYAPTRIRAKFVRFHISAYGYVKNAPDFTLPNKDTPKTRPVLHPNRRRGAFGGVCNTPLHGYMKNLAGFGLCHTTWRETRQVLDFATRHSAKPGGFLTLPHDIARNPAGFSHCHTFE